LILDGTAAEKKWKTLKNARGNAKRPKPSGSGASKSSSDYLYGTEMGFLNEINERPG
jgi:hypothetical protein